MSKNPKSEFQKSNLMPAPGQFCPKKDLFHPQLCILDSEWSKEVIGSTFLNVFLFFFCCPLVIYAINTRKNALIFINEKKVFAENSVLLVFPLSWFYQFDYSVAVLYNFRKLGHRRQFSKVMAPRKTDLSELHSLLNCLNQLAS